MEIKRFCYCFTFPDSVKWKRQDTIISCRDMILNLEKETKKVGERQRETEIDRGKRLNEMDQNRSQGLIPENWDNK